MGRQSRVVLLTEDDECIREILADYLEGLNIQVVQASDAAEALRRLEQSADEINLLFTDVKMPGAIDGMQLAELVTATWPAVAVLISSGHVRPTRRELPVRSIFLAKPYSFAELNATINKLIPGFLLKPTRVN